MDKTEGRIFRVHETFLKHWGCSPDDTNSTAMEIVLRAEDHSLAGFHALAHVGPLTCQLNTRFDRFGTRVHWKHHVVAEHACHGLREPPEDGVVERSRGER